MRHCFGMRKKRCPRARRDASKSSRLHRTGREDNPLGPRSESVEMGEKNVTDCWPPRNKVWRFFKSKREHSLRSFFRMRSTTDVAITASSVSRHDGVTILLGTESGTLFQGNSTVYLNNYYSVSVQCGRFTAALDSRVPLDPEKLASAEIADDGEDWLDPVKAMLGKHT